MRKTTLELPVEVQDVFLSYSVLKLDNASMSHSLLVRACSFAAPVARKRGWKVGRLKEFAPKNGSLYGLNVNGGREISIRTRSEHGFLDEDHILGTLLHELVHIVHGNHSAAFYDMLKELWVETEAVMFRQRFNIAEPNRNWGDGRILGGNKSLEAARSRQFSIGHRLGGVSTTEGLAAREAAARAALARWRLEDSQTCATQESEDDLQIVNIHEESPPRSVTSSRLLDFRPSEVIILLDDDGKIEDSEKIKGETVDLTREDCDGWTCSFCSYLNDEGNLLCGNCLQVCSNKWRCPRCTFVNVASHLQCLTCHTVKPA